MTVAVPDITAPPSPWRPPSDPLLLTTASQPLGLCYHGNFSLSFVDDANDVGDDVVDADDIRSILELAEQCALGVSVKDSVDLEQDMYPKEVSPPPSPCEEPTSTYEPCRFTAGVKRKLDFDSYDYEVTPANGEAGGAGERAASEYMDRQRVLEVSLCKMRRMEDPETSLRRCVLINNMTVKLKRDLDHHDQHCRNMLPKKRHILRRTDTSTLPPCVAGPLVPQTPGCRYDSYVGNKFLRRTADACEPMMSPLSPCKESEDVMRENMHVCHVPSPGMMLTEGTRGNGDARESVATPDDDAPSIFGDIDNVFQSLLSCLGEPI